MVLIGTALAAVTGTGFAVAAEPGAPAPPASPLVWADCRGGFQCATMQVPLDHRQLDGPTISLALIKRPATDPARRTGTLFLQPGGPGGSGLSFVRGNYADLPADLKARFDVFGFDARGVGKSSPLECFDDARYTNGVTAAKGRPDKAAFAPAVAEAAEFNAACVQKAGALLPFVGTEYVARDIDLMRAALGEEKITYYGRSFGTYIGTVYADLFPGRVRAMALDGAYDPVRYANQPYRYDRPQYLALDRAMRKFLDWCGATTPAMCPFGNGDPESAFEQLLRDLDAQPVPIPNRGTANGYTVTYRLLFNLNEGRALWPAIGKALSQAEQRNPASFLLSPPSAASFDFLTANVVVECVDRLYPRDQRLLRSQVLANTKVAPLLGPALAFGPPTYDHQHATACTQWPGERTSRYRGSYRAAGSAPILVLGTTGDPDTPYRDAVALSRTLENATLLTFQAEGHTAFGRSQCATGAVTAYLADLTVPPPNRICSDEPPPVLPAPPATPAPTAPPTTPAPTGSPAPVPSATTTGAQSAQSEIMRGVDESVERMRSPR